MDSAVKDLLEAGAAGAAILTCIGGAILFGGKAIRHFLSKRSLGRGDGEQADSSDVGASQVQQATKGAISIQAGRDVKIVGGINSTDEGTARD